jgi:hypothetical protein
MKKEFNIRKFIHTTIREYLIENNNIDNFPMNEIEFADFIEERLGGNSDTDINDELPEEIYIEIPANYKKIYQDKMYEYGIYIPQSKNKSLIRDLMKRDFKKFENSVLNWVKYLIDEVENYSEFYNEDMRDYFSSAFIKSVDEIIQGRIIERLINGLKEGTITIDKETFNSFNNNVRNLILKYRLKGGDLDGETINGLASEIFILDWM